MYICMHRWIRIYTYMNRKHTELKFWKGIVSSTRHNNIATPHKTYVVLDIVNILRPRKNGRHFAVDIFKCIFFDENAWISLKISLKFVPEVRINNIPAFIQIIAWRQPGDKPLSEPMMVSLLTHLCVTRPQWVKPALRVRPFLTRASEPSPHSQLVTGFWPH